ncbi:hypothetical protein BWQ96_10663 [Gracilariopsis chorda]|uniref:Uncharacterized protein n=1 Tax=Gracilariopsis chorda TaxID=448386 RepID=A0A2V3IEL8_9FLOR|nr:hypothetical protein BWQ96_10663 [Gracilariopsis chorda]|eukprot:PXF39640.1 hypothetical protein BWQ96_10663 [Gracilariopsis chorda]
MIQGDNAANLYAAMRTHTVIITIEERESNYYEQLQEVDKRAVSSSTGLRRACRVFYTRTCQLLDVVIALSLSSIPLRTPDFMDLKKLSRSGTHTVDMEGVIHAVPPYDNPNICPSHSDLWRQPENPPVSHPPTHEKDRSSSSRSFWSTVMDFPPSTFSSASTLRTAVTSVSSQLN